MDKSENKDHLNLTTDCSMDLFNTYVADIERMYMSSVALSLLHCLTAIMAISGNGLVITAIFKTQSLHTQSNSLLCCLAITDFLTGLISQPATSAALISRTVGYYQTFCTAQLVSFMAGYFLSGVSFLTLALVSFDRFLAIHLHLRYESLVTIPRLLFVEACLALVVFSTVLTSFFWFWLFEILVAVITLVGLLVNLASYSAIFRIILRHKVRICSQAELRSQIERKEDKREFDIGSFKRSYRTMAAIFVLFCLCYIPLLCTMFAFIFTKSKILSLRIRLAYGVSTFLACMNGTINPIFYCLRIAEFRQAILKLVKRNWKSTYYSNELWW